MRPKHLGRIKDADGVGDTQNLRCGDVMKIYIKIGRDKDKEYIKEASFQTMGCGHAIAISDMICGLAKGKTLEEAKKVGFQDIAAEVGEVPQVKLHCVRLAETALKSAVEDYERKRKK